MKSKSIRVKSLKGDDIVRVLMKLPNSKRGIWPERNQVLEYYSTNEIVTESAKNGKFGRAAIEDVRLTIS